ncbi:hypothetical protein Tco_0175324 [Tanacetum coccineum]
MRTMASLLAHCGRITDSDESRNEPCSWFTPKPCKRMTKGTTPLFVTKHGTRGSPIVETVGSSAGLAATRSISRIKSSSRHEVTIPNPVFRCSEFGGVTDWYQSLGGDWLLFGECSTGKGSPVHRCNTRAYCATHHCGDRRGSFLVYIDIPFALVARVAYSRARSVYCLWASSHRQSHVKLVPVKRNLVVGFLLEQSLQAGDSPLYTCTYRSGSEISGQNNEQSVRFSD